jgi:ABC-type Fe3+-hydroxamate transport system substrate-binding protein
LYDLGLSEEVVGITKFCVHPNKWFRTKQRVGGTKTADIAKIKLLQPTLILANKEENVKDQIEELQKDFLVWTSDVNTVEDALKMIVNIGVLVNKADEARRLSEEIRTSFRKLTKLTKNIKTAYLIWRDPYMAAGGDTFISSMLNFFGFDNVLSNISRYPELTIQDLKDKGCELVLLSSEPYPFKQTHVEEIQKQMPETRVLLADGEIFSWYGSRMLHAPSYISKIIAEIEAPEAQI